MLSTYEGWVLFAECGQDTAFTKQKSTGWLDKHGGISASPEDSLADTCTLSAGLYPVHDRLQG